MSKMAKKDINGSLRNISSVYSNSTSNSSERFNMRSRPYEIVKKNKIVSQIKKISRRTDPGQNYLGTLFSKCSLHHTSSKADHKRFFNIIYESLNSLYENEMMAILMQFISGSKNLKIVFDLETSSVCDMDFMSNESVPASCYPARDVIFIAAKGLHNSNQVMGVIAKEMCRYAMHFLYQNDGKPYKQGDGHQENFNEIIKICKANKDKNEEICNTFKIPKELQQAELITVVAFWLGFYNQEDNLNHIEVLKPDFPELFKYFEEKVLHDLIR